MRPQTCAPTALLEGAPWLPEVLTPTPRLSHGTCPPQLLEIVQQQLGRLVGAGLVIALGFSGHANGLKWTRMPVVAVLVPGLPMSFAIVFYFLLETRQLQAGGTLLPLHLQQDHESTGLAWVRPKAATSTE